MLLRTLFGLTLAVALAHWLLLSPALGRVVLGGSSPVAPLVARVVPPAPSPVVPIAPVPAAPLPAAVAPPKPAAPAAAAPPAKPALPKPTDNSTSVANTALLQNTRAEALPEIKTPEKTDEYAQAATNTIAKNTTAAFPDDTAPSAKPAPIPLSVTMQFPPEIELVYAATAVRNGQPFQGNGSVSWKSDGARYTLRYESSLLFVNLITQTSVGTLGAQGLEPERFSDSRRGRSEQAAHFVRSTKLINFSNNRPSAPILEGAQDRVSITLQLAAILAGNPERFSAGTNIEMQVASADEAEMWVFKVNGVEQTVTPAGTSQAIHVTRNPRRELDPRLEFWFAPNLHFVPVRIKQTEANGNSADLLLRSPALR